MSKKLLYIDSAGNSYSYIFKENMETSFIFSEDLQDKNKILRISVYGNELDENVYKFYNTVRNLNSIEEVHFYVIIDENNEIEVFSNVKKDLKIKEVKYVEEFPDNEVKGIIEYALMTILQEG